MQTGWIRYPEVWYYAYQAQIKIEVTVGKNRVLSGWKEQEHRLKPGNCDIDMGNISMHLS